MCFDGGWPQAPHRALRNGTLESWDGVLTVGTNNTLPIDVVAECFGGGQEPGTEPSRLGPSTSTAARPRPSPIPPAAMTGTGATASTTAGTSGSVATCPRTCPPASHPCATTTSTPEATDAAGRPASPSRPSEDDVVATDPDGRSYRRYSDVIPLAGMDGQVEELALYAGQATGLVSDTASAAEIVARLVSEASAALDAFANPR